jgi:cyclopropane fatty-acyl-phospholipid synthase-like methyltransferase
MRSRSEWKQYWGQQTLGLNREETESFYRRFAAELKLVIGAPGSRVLEIGCGDGALYAPLGFDETDYTGVDFSPTMLQRFADRHPRARVVLVDAEDYRNDDGPYDLIFSCAVIQYLDTDSFGRLLGNVEAMLAPDGAVVTASVPCRALRLRYLTGEMQGQRPTLAQSLPRVAGGLLRNRIGSWYSFAELAEIGEQHGFRSELFGSMHYAYRFHVRMTRHR